ncbi:unnamed protein product [Lepeophtheirus salmonis]|uniref:(salmon louse) hypothetical protein n=1 Tax=Lepeophtheirus salmonis TaxID=72036 RepID=A0A7R8CQB1_LEPSM|nr:unnamed protein product [Lepeophtheirus salmonis]CAF2893639.1 unnamed protein product [Lepeophtheirus salmonis]
MPSWEISKYLDDVGSWTVRSAFLDLLNLLFRLFTFPSSHNEVRCKLKYQRAFSGAAQEVIMKEYYATESDTPKYQYLLCQVNESRLPFKDKNKFAWKYHLFKDVVARTTAAFSVVWMGTTSGRAGNDLAGVLTHLLAYILQKYPNAENIILWILAWLKIETKF